MILHIIAATGSTCSLAGNSGTGASLLGFPHWYQYLTGMMDNNGNCIPTITGISDVWLIVAAIIQILLHLAGIIAIVMIIVGGVQFVLSQGNPDNAQKARTTIIYALIGLVLAVGATALVSFIAGQFNS